MSIESYRITGGSKEDRAENDFYATNPKALEMLFNAYTFDEGDFLEPCVGKGHLAEKIKEKYPLSNVVGLDLVDRGYPGTIVHDFITWGTEQRFDGIITNPPYSLAQEFIEKGIKLLTSNGKMAMFLKLHFLESAKRKELFEKYPPKYIYVFRNRMSTWRDGNEYNHQGKKWTTTMCHAWFVWEKGSSTEPIIRWL